MTDRQVKIYKSLSTCSRRAIKRKKTRGGKSYYYNPRGDLLERLSRDFGLSIEAVYLELLDMRAQFVPQDFDD